MTFLGDMLVPWRVFPKPDFFNMFWHLGKDILGTREANAAYSTTH